MQIEFERSSKQGRHLKPGLIFLEDSINGLPLFAYQDASRSLDLVEFKAF